MRLRIGEEHECYECNGSGERVTRFTDERGVIYKREYRICHRCNGQGKITWWNCDKDERVE